MDRGLARQVQRAAGGIVGQLAITGLRGQEVGLDEAAELEGRARRGARGDGGGLDRLLAGRHHGAFGLRSLHLAYLLLCLADLALLLLLGGEQQLDLAFQVGHAGLQRFLPRGLRKGQARRDQRDKQRSSQRLARRPHDALVHWIASLPVARRCRATGTVGPRLRAMRLAPPFAISRSTPGRCDHGLSRTPPRRRMDAANWAVGRACAAHIVQVQGEGAMADIHPVDPQFAAKARINKARYEELYRESVENPEGFWAKAAERLDWFRKPTRIKDVSYDLSDFHIKWFEDGELNASVNCLDRQLETRGNKIALLFEPDSPDAPARGVTYRELYERTCRLANALRNLGVAKGDRVTIYLPMIVDAAVAMLACARIGAVHSVVFGGFAPNSIADRVADCGSKLIITADEGLRGGRKIPLKANVDAALKLPGTNTVETVLVVRHTGGAVEMQAPRDRWFHDVVDSQPAQCEPERMNAEDPLFILYTSGSTGKPKACCTPPAATCCSPPTPTRRSSTCARTTSTGVPPTSAGSPATATSSTARWPMARPR
jgi:Acyl-coenzyme A synthetases/AMP-(fatty) acid ligases